jgi:agmatine deiminase
LCNVLGIKKVIWLKQGLYYDETNGHIDNILSFVDYRTILLSWTDDIQNPQKNILQAVYDVLINEKTITGESFRIIKVPMPPTMSITKDEAAGIKTIMNSKPRQKGDTLLATYSNAYVFNGGVILPIYGSKLDEIAINIYRETFTDRAVYPLYAKELLIGGGGFHCIFHEIPEVKNNYENN